jgi:hypothetical protein
MRKHKAKIHKWENGELKTEEKDFNSYDEAIIWCGNNKIENFKIYDLDGNLIFVSNYADQDLYA